jgi:hypothetical protein
VPWDYILGGASAAGLVFIFGIIFLNKYLESLVDNRFEERLERFRSERTRELEFDKSDLAVWADLRKDVLCQLWSTHRDLSRLMTQVILQVQEVQWSGRELGSMRDAIEKYRRSLHASSDLLSPDSAETCQQFLDTAVDILNAKRATDDGNPLKRIRGKFATETATLFGLEKMMPWMARGADAAIRR